MSKAPPAETAHLLADAADHAPDAIWVLESPDPQGVWRIAYANAAFENIYGVSRDDAVGRPVDALLAIRAPAGDTERTLAALRRMRPFRTVHARYRADEPPFWIEANYQPRTEGSRELWIVVSRDVTETILMQRRSKHLSRALDEAQEAIAVSVSRNEQQWTFEYVNRAFTDILGYDPRELVGQTWRALFAREADMKQVDDYRIGLLTGQKVRGELPFRRKDGSVVLLSISATPFSGDAEPGEMWTVATLHDVTKSRTEERRLREQAYTDPLTGLANRREFERLMQTAMEMARPGQRAHVVMFVDLDGFKNINDAHGHDTGDRVLISVAKTLRGTLLPSDDVARWGGDEFAAILYFCTPEQAVRRGEACIAALASTPECRGVGASIGIVRIEHAASSSEIMQRADRLVYQAKAAGRNRVIAEA